MSPSSFLQTFVQRTFGKDTQKLITKLTVSPEKRGHREVMSKLGRILLQRLDQTTNRLSYEFYVLPKAQTGIYFHGSAWVKHPDSLRKFPWIALAILADPLLLQVPQSEKLNTFLKRHAYAEITPEQVSCLQIPESWWTDD